MRKEGSYSYAVILDYYESDHGVIISVTLKNIYSRWSLFKTFLLSPCLTPWVVFLFPPEKLWRSSWLSLNLNYVLTLTVASVEG